MPDESIDDEWAAGFPWVDPAWDEKEFLFGSLLVVEEAFGVFGDGEERYG